MAVLAAHHASAQVSVLMANYDTSRANANLNETILNTLNVNNTQFGKLFSLPVTGNINAQPLYVPNVSIPGSGTHNVVYVATHHNEVYAFDADMQGSSLWNVNLGPSVPGTDFNVADLPEIGIMGTPVIDSSTGTLYVVAYTKENGAYFFRLHALDISTGKEKFGAPVVIQTTVRGTANFDSVNGQTVFDPGMHLQRPGLVLLNNVVYVEFGSHNDISPWHGWFIGYSAANVQQQVSVFITSPTGWGGAIWQGGRAPAVDSQGNFYWATGNGTFDGNLNFGESLMKVSASSGNTKMTDWFTPDDWANLNNLDEDFGSCGPLLTQSGMVIAGGKEGIVYLMDQGHLGHMQSGNGQILQHFQAIGFGIFNMAFWDRRGGPVLYLRANSDGVKAFQIVGNRFQTTPFTQAGFNAGLPFDGMAISANGSTEYSGILWVTLTPDGDQDGDGTLYAFSALDLSKELWNSDTNSGRDSLGTLAKFVAPTIANGKVYVATFSGSLMVYGLLSQKAVIGQIVNAASGYGGPVAPGEMVAIYGSDLGGAQLAQAQLASPGKLTTSVAGTQVLINNVPAPLAYVRADQVGAIVPDAVANGMSAGVEVQYQGQSTSVVQVPVAATAPGVFTLDQSGRGQGAILNQDSSINTAANPAAAGSIVVLFATGQGAMNPPWPEDELGSAPLPVPVSKVTVTIGGKPADILYAGAAPELAGIIQINARVPSATKPGAEPVVVTIGSVNSQPGVTVAVK